MLRLCFVTMLLFAALSAFSVEPAGALMAVGDPIDGGSWTEWFIESGVGDYDFMRLDWMSGSSDFEPVTFGGMAGGWAPVWDTPLSSAVSGPDVDNMTFSLKFTGGPASSQTISFYFTAYDGDNLKESTLAAWNGSGWAFSGSGGWNPGTASPIPEPTTLVLLGTGLGMTGILARRRRKS